MPLSNKELVKNYRARQRQALGETEYKRQQALKKKEYRARKKAAAQATAQAAQPEPVVVVETTPEPVDECDTLLNKIFQKKKTIVESQGKTINFDSYKRNTWKNLQKIYKKKYGEPWDCRSPAWIKKADEIIAFIKETYSSKNTQITYISSFASVTVALGKSYKKAYDKYSEISSKDRIAKDAIDNKNLSTPAETDKMISYKSLRNLYKSDNLTDRQRALVSLYTRLPPRRVQLAQYLKLSNTDDDLDDGFNYLIVDKHNKPIKVVMTKYKTHKIYGDFELLLENKFHLNSILKKYIETSNIKNGNLMFPNHKGTINKNMSDEIKNAFRTASGKPLTVNIIRHIFVSEFLKRPRSIEEKKLIAQAMGHSKATQERYMRLDAPK